MAQAFAIGVELAHGIGHQHRLLGARRQHGSIAIGCHGPDVLEGRHAAAGLRHQGRVIAAQRADGVVHPGQQGQLESLAHPNQLRGPGLGVVVGTGTKELQIVQQPLRRLGGATLHGPQMGQQTRDHALGVHVGLEHRPRLGIEERRSQVP